eukprot:CAMPEP_0175174090 /NCGR_PEP_ID=MMETSP0087-20121206/32430_1 /TAXON_ID=136419 /ORGANISM="Unknown Unknown, Strain D1" /LENGTH=114 /DNA_ID=CAMNT_0016465503 /DNA_START=13 /DNA_END=354 /DNA_ORIENTATION=-
MEQELLHQLKKRDSERKQERERHREQIEQLEQDRRAAEDKHKLAMFQERQEREREVEANLEEKQKLQSLLRKFESSCKALQRSESQISSQLNKQKAYVVELQATHRSQETAWIL